MRPSSSSERPLYCAFLNIRYTNKAISIIINYIICMHCLHKLLLHLISIPTTSIIIIRLGNSSGISHYYRNQYLFIYHICIYATIMKPHKQKIQLHSNSYSFSILVPEAVISEYRIIKDIEEDRTQKYSARRSNVDSCNVS